MKKYLYLFAAVAAALSFTGCSASLNGTGKFEGTDIGGHKETLGDMLGEFFGGITAGAGDMAAPGSAAAEGIAADTAVGAPDAAIAAEPTEPSGTNNIQPQSGLLTGGEWNDNSHWADWNALYSSRNDWNNYKKVWKTTDDNRIKVMVTSGGKPLEGAVAAAGNAIAVTDNKGIAYLYPKTEVSGITVSCGEIQTNAALTDGSDSVEIELENAVSPISPKLDLMIMCDTTGSMGDELEYLKVELEDIVKSIKSNNANIPTRVSVNFYRDTDDEYEVRQFPFSENIDEVVKAIRKQSAMGGGDFPEAVHTALDSAINNHDWDDNSVKIMFLVLDAPPHDDAQTVDSVNKYISQAAEKGIRIIPVASSGIDKSTEYLLRAMAFTTGGTYTFLTDDSGVGGGHIEPTVGAYNVEKLKDMMIRIVNSYLE